MSLKDVLEMMLTRASINFFLHGKRRISSKKSAEPHEVSEVSLGALLMRIVGN
jgi:hypothetical protein